MLLSDIVFMDFEASALRDSYPIEVGWAWVEGNNVQAESLLISPADEWLTPGFVWDPAAEGIHGLPLARLLSEGCPVRQVCNTLNDKLQGKVAVFDTGPDGVDRHWLDLLFAEGELVRAFRLGGSAGELLQALATENGVPEAAQAKIKMAAPPINHRAAQDAAHYAWRASAIQLMAHQPPDEGFKSIAKQIAVRGAVRG